MSMLQDQLVHVQCVSDAACHTATPGRIRKSSSKSTRKIYNSSQRERCQEAFLATRDSLLESLDPHSAKSVIEASSLLGRKWLSVIPFSPALRLSDFEVSADLHYCLKERCGSRGM
jgi:hypothetical protein